MGVSHLKNHKSFNSVMTFMLGKNNFHHQLVLTHEKYYQYFHFKLYHLVNVICVCVCVCVHARHDVWMHASVHTGTCRYSSPITSAHEYLRTELIFNHYKLW